MNNLTKALLVLVLGFGGAIAGGVAYKTLLSDNPEDIAPHALATRQAEEDKSTPKTQQAPAINVVTAKRMELVETITATGSVVAREEVLAGADVAGLKVMELLADTGDYVKKGQLLARLDRSTLQLQLTELEAQDSQLTATALQAEAQIATAEVAVKQASEDLERAQKLVRRGVAASSQRDNAVNAYDSANAQLNTARQALAATKARRAIITAQRKQIELQLEKTDVRAPAAGLVLSRSASLGAIVSATAGPLFRLAKSGDFELAAEVPDTELASMSKGMGAAVHVAGQADPLTGELRLVSPEIDPRSRMGKVFIALDADKAVSVGGFGRAVIERNRREGISVPLSSVIFDDQKAYLQIVNDNKISTRPIKLGIRTGDRVEVVEGAQDGDMLVARAGTFVNDGDEITPIVMDEKTGAVKP